MAKQSIKTATKTQVNLKTKIPVIVGLATATALVISLLVAFGQFVQGT